MIQPTLKVTQKILLPAFSVVLISLIMGYGASGQKTTTPSSKKGKLEAYSYSQDVKTDTQTVENFTYTSSDMIATGKHAVYHQKKQFLTATGEIVIDDSKNHVTGDKAEVDDSPNKKLAIITGKVVITVKPKADPTKPVSTSGNKKEVNVADERNRGVVVTCNRVENSYKKKFVVMKGEPVFTQKITREDGTVLTRVLTCEHVEYDGKTEKAVLFAPVKMTDSDGGESNFEQNVLIGTKEGEETVSSKGKSSSVFPVKEDDTPQ